MSEENGSDGGVAELAKRARTPSLIGAAVGAAAAAAMAKRSSHAPSQADDDEPETHDDGPDDERHADGSGSTTAADLRDQVLEGLLGQFAEGSGYFDVALMDRIERLIRTREELEDYVTVLAKRISDEQATADTFGRLERLLARLGR